MNPKIIKTLEYQKILHKVAHHASTSLGKETAEKLEPKGDFELVKLRLQATDEAVNVERLKGNAPFGGIRDIRAPLHRARIGGMLNPTELLEISTTMFGSRRLKRFVLAAHEEYAIPMLKAQVELLTENKQLEDKINSCIDENAVVVDGASPELGRVRSELRTGEGRVRERLEQMIRNSSVQKMLQDVLITIRNDRFVIPVKSEYRSSFGGMIHDQSASGATLYIEPDAIVQLNNKIRELKFKEEAEIEKILRALTELVAEQVEVLVLDVDQLAELDFTFAKAGLARELKATMPRLNDRGFIKIKRGRHPLIAADAVVPLDLELGNDYSQIIVTGPNTGGKTVSLKTVGLLSLMAMSGLFVPAEEGTQLCVFDAIYADIGDEQSIEQNLSTFSSHMTNIISILRDMTPKSLVLLDELGAGTDPAEGSALAISILDYIHQIGCRIIATTHYSELKAYAYQKQGTINASMEFDIQTLSPTYRLLVGVPGRSNAFAIAERLGLSRRIIEHARTQVGEEDQRVESMIASLEENRLIAESERYAAEELRKEAEAMRKSLEAQQLKFDEQRDKLLEKAERDAREAVVKARREADEVIADLRRMALEEAGGVKDHKLVEAKRRLDQATPELRSKQVRALKKRPERIEAGDEVRVISLGQKGHVVELVGTTEANVQLGIMKMKVQLSNLEKTGNAPQSKQPQKVATTLKRTRDDNVKMELDMRGMNMEEALIEADRFLDESFLSNFGQVYLIHGKGTGVLRTGMQEYLRRHRHVKSYRMGNYNEGGAGVTVVELK
ncbi:Endonuclease MutS2 [Paenibacillus allorhizoplanae]|uniref:Endonuclease MutS2 n=1 Tax=Paenibacillus allorhizoplanae TaxID=2905648 RepID=A0ABN8GSP9_9BACL|nr:MULTISPECIES: endonuclease MutS2 [Paenibacillus]KRE75771.1 recombination and DNA strand exchange inhibitor protein [Paenibacillus sp. Soil750]CAH1212110.1 Endonuclease MutS2 [Paenibacillus allorhizoplanae]